MSTFAVAVSRYRRPVLDQTISGSGHVNQIPLCIVGTVHATAVHRCLHGNAPQYHTDSFNPTTMAASRQRLRSASRHQLIVPRQRRTSFTGRWAFSIAGPMAWNSLPDYLRDTSPSEDTFWRSLFVERVTDVWNSLHRNVDLSSLSKFKKSLNQIDLSLTTSKTCDKLLDYVLWCFRRFYVVGLLSSFYLKCF